MARIPFIFLLIVAAVIGVSTFVEDACGTSFIATHVYGTWWFRVLWTLTLGVAVVLAAKRKMWRKLPQFIFHVSFVVIFIGAMTTAFTGKKGLLHLREGENVVEYADADGRQHLLPFAVRLDSFYVEHYPGTEAPSDYVSRLTCLDYGANVKDRGMKAIDSPTVSMNRIHSHQGYRFYQSSYDDDMRGSWLSVNYDPWGTAITYTGFLIFGLGCVLLLCNPRGEFRALLRHPLIRKGGLFLLLIYIGASEPVAASLPVVKRAQADSLATKLIVYNDRVAPLNTLAKDFVQKLYGRATYHHLTSEQVLSSWILAPAAWNQEPIILIKNAKLRAALGLEGKYASMADLFDEYNQYKLRPIWQREQGKHTKLEKAILEVDEKVGLVLMLHRGTLMQPVPSGTPLPSSTKIQAELLYNRIPFSMVLFMVNLTLGFIGFGLLLWRMLKGRKEGSVSRRVWSTVLWVVTLFHFFGYVLRGYVSGNIPLSNGYETMQFVSLVLLLTASLLQRKFPFIRPFGLLLSGFTLLVSHLGEMNPQITPLVPVLASPWLSYHVSFIMVSYALFAFTVLNAVLVLVLMARRSGNTSQPSTATSAQVEQLTLLSRLLLYPATCLLGVGIIMGAVWANVSWGSYWSWDPKEVWALVAFIVYGLTFHRQSLPWMHKPIVFHVYMIIAFLVVLMTYFGVNYFLGGMHSYA